jgi:dynein heavy chain
MEKANKLVVIKYSDINYLRGIQTAVQAGLPCLLENVGENLDPG